MSSSDEEDQVTDPQAHKRKFTSRLDIWEHFVREERNYGKTKHRVATCKFCLKAGKKLIDLRGEKSYLQRHLLDCTSVPSSIKKKHAGISDPSSTVEKRSAEEFAGGAPHVKLSTKQGSMAAFLDRPLTGSETIQFERLLAEFFLDCNVAFRSIESPSLMNLLTFLRPTVKLPSRPTFTRRVVKSRIAEAHTEIEEAFRNQSAITLTFDGFKNVSKNKLLGKS